MPFLTFVSYPDFFTLDILDRTVRDCPEHCKTFRNISVLYPLGDSYNNRHVFRYYQRPINDRVTNFPGGGPESPMPWCATQKIIFLNTMPSFSPCKSTLVLPYIAKRTLQSD